MRIAAQPDLYSSPKTEDEEAAPILFGTRCACCERVSFPALAIGCDVCGASEDRLTRVELSTAGVLHSIAQVHLHRGEPEAPFTVGEIRLDGGPLLRAMIASDSGPLRIGDRVTAAWQVVSHDEDGNEVVEPYFRQASS